MSNPDFARYYNIAIRAYKLDIHDKALDSIDNALDLEPESYQALHAKGLILKKLAVLRKHLIATNYLYNIVKI